jgi:hypothetical protein
VIDQVVDKYIDRVKNDVLNDQMRDIPLAYLMQKELPKSIKHYFDQEVENWIIEEESKFESSDRFDYDTPEIRMKIDQIFDILKNTATFSINKFNQLLERAIKLEKDFTIRPHWTMANFIFKEKDTVRTKEVNDTLRYFFVHDHYKEKLTEYFNLKYMQEINLEQFKVLVKEIDEKLFSSNMIEEAKKMLKTIADFMSDADEGASLIALDIIIMSLKDRKLESLANSFEKLTDSGKTDISLADAIELIEKGSVEDTSVEEAKEVKLDDIDVSDVTVEKEVEEDEEDDEEDEEDEPVAEVEDSSPQQETSDRGYDAGSALADVVKSKVSTGHPLEDLAGMIDKGMRKKFIKKLFKKNEAAYTEIISTLNSMSDWKDASLLIEDEFYNYEINPYAKEALAFSDICYSRFFPHDKYVG